MSARDEFNALFEKPLATLHYDEDGNTLTLKVNNKSQDEYGPKDLMGNELDYAIRQYNLDLSKGIHQVKDEDQLRDLMIFMTRW